MRVDTPNAAVGHRRRPARLRLEGIRIQTAAVGATLPASHSFPGHGATPVSADDGLICRVCMYVDK